MCRFTCGVLLVLAIFFAIWALWGVEAAVSVLFASFFGLSLASLLLPKRGPQYAYRNRVVLIVFVLLIVVGLRPVRAPLS